MTICYLTKTIGVIISDIRQGYFADVIKSIESRANQRGFNVILCDSEDDAEKEELYLDILLRKGVDGFIFSPINTNQIIEELWLSELPCVQIDRKLDSGEADFIGIDNVKSAELAVNRLMDNGFLNVAFIGYGNEVYTMKKRVEGYTKAVSERGRPFKCLQIADYTKTDLKMQITNFLKKHPEIDALVCGNDDLCFATLRALDELGLEIPDDMGLITFDDVRWLRIMKCPLTTVRQPTEQTGVLAVDRLVDRIENKSDEPFADILLDSEMVIRKSCQKRR